MDTSPTLSAGGTRARAALLATTGTGTGSSDRRVVFLASQSTIAAGHETRTWPHHWSPQTVMIYALYDFYLDLHLSRLIVCTLQQKNMKKKTRRFGSIVGFFHFSASR